MLNKDERPTRPSLARAIVLLPFLQLAGCVLDLTSGQAVVRSLLCFGPSDNQLGMVGLVLWLLLVLSLPLGFVAIKYPKLTPPYLLLFGLIPVALALQEHLILANVFTCDGP